MDTSRHPSEQPVCHAASSVFGLQCSPAGRARSFGRKAGRGAGEFLRSAEELFSAVGAHRTPFSRHAGTASAVQSVRYLWICVRFK